MLGKINPTSQIKWMQISQSGAQNPNGVTNGLLCRPVLWKPDPFIEELGFFFGMYFEFYEDSLGNLEPPREWAIRHWKGIFANHTQVRSPLQKKLVLFIGTEIGAPKDIPDLGPELGSGD